MALVNDLSALLSGAIEEGMVGFCYFCAWI